MYKWKPDDADLLKRCFENDWDYGKLPRLVKNEDDLNLVK